MLEEVERKVVNKKQPRRPKTIIMYVVGIVAISMAAGWWILLRQQPAAIDPFNSHVLAAMQFPLYYPTTLPTGYRTDAKSVNVPQAGVVVFNLVGPEGKKLYVSEEARPSTFSIGNFYAKLSNLKEVPVSDGAIAVGRIHNGATEIASRANNQTWILCDTNGRIPFEQLIEMLRSIKLSS